MTHKSAFPCTRQITLPPKAPKKIATRGKKKGKKLKPVKPPKPVVITEHDPGLSKLEYFAARVMQSLISRSDNRDYKLMGEIAVSAAVALVGALEQREKDTV